MKDNRVAVALGCYVSRKKMALSQSEQRHTRPLGDRRGFQMTLLAQVSKHRQAFSGPTSEAAGAEAEVAAAQVAEAPVDEEEEAQVDAEAPADEVAAPADGVADAEEAVAVLQQYFALSAG